MIFYKTNLDQDDVVLNILNTFHKVSGQSVNFSKFGALFSPFPLLKRKKMLIK